MKIKTITQIGISLCIVVIVTMGVFVFMTIQKMKHENYEAILAAETVKDIAELRIVMHEYLLHPEERSLIQWKSKYNLLSKSFIQEENNFDSQNGNILFNKMHQNFLRIGIVFGELSTEVENDLRNDRQKDKSFLKLKNRLAGELLVRSQAMISLAFQLQDSIQTHVAGLYQISISLIIVFFILFTFLVVGILFWINNSVAKPITALEQGTRIIGSGNLNHKIGTDVKNEIGELSRAFDKMAMDLKRTTTSIAELNKEIVERKQAEEALKESEKRFRIFFQQGLIGMTISSVEKGWIDANDAFCDMLGYSINELSKMAWTELTYPDDLEAELTQFRRLLAGEINNYSLEKRFIRSDSKIIFTVISVNAIYKADDNSVDYILAIAQDITERKQAEVERKKLENQLLQAQKMESVGRLAGGVAHDYNNALSVIMGYTELAMLEVDPTETLYDDLNQILTASNRAANITRQLLAFARKQTIAPKVLDLNENVESMLKMLRHLIGEDIDLTWLPGSELWNVKMDPTQIDQILANLCVNARDAIQGVGKIIIETNKAVLDEAYCAEHAGFAPGQFVQLTISDNGCGIPKEILDNVFEPFFTTKDVDKGTGLGLSTVYGIVKQNKGFINIYSESGEGTSIKIYLPRNDGKIIDIQEEDMPAIPQGCGETILLVEDDLPILKLTEKILNGLGYTVLAADTPKDAIRLAKEHTGKIHLLVTDVIMPEMHGPDLANNIQSLYYPDAKLLFMSGYTADTIAHHGVLDEGVDFIQKPFSKQNLARIIRKILDESKTQLSETHP